MSYPLSCLRNNDWTGFLRAITDFCLILAPNEKQELKEELKVIRAMRYHDAPLDQEKILEAADAIFDKLHNAGYIVGSNMTPAQRPTGDLGGLRELKFNKRDHK